MSSVVQLQIQGIRSFGTKAEDKQSIIFSSPVTLILGANGCGKTTIIECLKYALTGELPPGSDRGKGFVHDPKIFDAAECLGQIKLKVKNLRGETLTVTRSVKTSYKRGNKDSVFNALDSNITYGEGDKESISKRVANVDDELMRFMGVSKPIINNVIFCHQENSCWPLDEPKKLKEKFDAIFGTTKYDKAITTLIQMKKRQADMLKDKKLELKYAEAMKKEADKKNLDLEQAKTKKQSLTESCDELDKELNPIEDRIATIQKVELQISKFNAEKIKLKTELLNCNEQIKSLRSKIKNEFTGNIPQLDREIRNFHEKMEEKKSELINFEEHLLLIKNKEKKIQSNLTDLERKKTALLHQRQQEQEFFGERAVKLTELCTSLKIEFGIDFENAEESEIQPVFKKIESSLNAEEKKILDISAEHDKFDREKQVEIDKCRENKTRFESDIQSKQSQKLNLEQELKQIDNDIRKNENDAKQLSQITDQINNLDEKLKQYQEKVNFERKRKIIDIKKEDIKKLQEKYRILDEKLTFLNSISKKMAEVNLKEKDLEKREAECKRVKTKHAGNIKEIFPNRIIESNFKRNFQNAYEDFQKKVKDLQDKENANRLKLKGLEIERSNKKNELTKVEREFQENSDMIFEKCCGTPYEEVLARTKENVEKYQLELGALKSSESMYKKYIKNIEQDPCCPLCHKNLSVNEASDVTNEMTDEIQKLPANIRKTEQFLKKEQKHYETIMSLRSLIERNKKLDIDIPKFKENLKCIENQIMELNTDIENGQMTIIEPQASLELVNSMLGDMALLDEALKDVSRIQVDLDMLKKDLPKDVETSNIDDLQLEKSTISAELENERNDLEKLDSSYQNEVNVFNGLREKKTTLKENQMKIQERVQALPQLKIRSEEISKNKNILSKEIEQLELDVKPLKLKLENLIKEKELSKNKNRQILNEANQELTKLKNIHREIQRLNNELKALAAQNLLQKINNIKQSFERTMNEQNENRKENDEMTEKIENLKIEISNQELFERDLKDNKELKLMIQKQTEINAKYDDLIKDIGNLNFETLSKERKDLIMKRDKCTVKRGKILGQTGEIDLQIEKLENELNDTKFKDSLKIYQKLFYEKEVLELIVKDLTAYNVALERALITYHSEKMQKINSLIREFWRQIYRGNDIDYIEIKTESDDAKEVTTESKRRSFKYSVVQSKNNSKLEMRGRCSAGQRVLASLIIRMALAETFSANCGVLALDEPTTNLDRNNIFSLCETLNRIVEERQTQCNFMLIIITHDEDFIQTLGKVESYHRVSRNNDGKSVIQKYKLSADF